MFKQYRGLRREVYILSFGRLVTGLGSMIWPMITLILSQKMGIGGQEISVLLAVAMIVMAPAIYLGGRIADHRDKKMTIVCFDLISVVCFLICSFIPMSWFLIFLLFIASLCQNMEHPVYSAFIADLSTTDERDRAYSLSYMCVNLGLMLSPTIAGILFKNHLNIAFFINGISVLCSTVLIYFFIKDYEPEEETSHKAVYQKAQKGVSFLQVLRENPLLIMFIIIMSGNYAFYELGDMYLIPLDLAAIHGENGALIYGTITSVNCVVVVIFTPLITKLFGRWSEPYRIMACVLLETGGYMFFVLFLGHIPFYYVFMMVFTWGEIFGAITLGPYMSKRVPSSHRGRIEGAMTFIETGFTSIMQLIAGFIYGAGGSHATWVLIIGGGLVTAVLTYILSIVDKNEYPNLYTAE